MFNLHRSLPIVRFSWFCLKLHPSSCKFTRFVRNFPHSLIRRPLFNIMNRMVLQNSMLKIEKICDALPKATSRFVEEIIERAQKFDNVFF